MLRNVEGKGLAQKWITELLQVAKERGYKKMRLTVYNTPQNKQPRSICIRKFGFYEIPAYNANPHVKLSMEKTLVD